MTAAALCWVRESPGLYTARGRHDDRWRIVQATSDRWEVYRDGSVFDSVASTLAEAKMVAEEEDDPEARARREARKKKRASRRVETLSSSASASLCYSGRQAANDDYGGFDGSGVHLTLNGRTTLCGLPVIDEPKVPRIIEPLSCKACYEVDRVSLLIGEL